VSDIAEFFNERAIHHDDGTHSYHYFSLTAGYVVIERLTLIEAFSIVVEVHDAINAGNDTEAVLIKWANGYRHSDFTLVDTSGDAGKPRCSKT
jgi:hypothetical protein